MVEVFEQFPDGEPRMIRVNGVYHKVATAVDMLYEVLKTTLARFS